MMGAAISNCVSRTGRLAAVIGFAAALMHPVGAAAKGVHASADPVKDEPPITEADREHWSFKRLIRPTPPVVQHDAAVKNDIDRFVLAKLEEKGLTLSLPADPVTLIRRVTFDLTGLPPTPDEVRAFVVAAGDLPSKQFDAAYEALVDRLLASERHGECWSQPWLDLARFAETDGFEHDKDRNQAWMYRDWVINALNRDMPYDEFVSAQLAGDELSPKDAIATGFLLAGPDMPDTNFQDERMHLMLNDITGTVGGALLGVTMGCAQCHDHPYDPISQADFYRLRACFDNMPKPKKDQQFGPMMKESGRTLPVSRVCIRGDHTRPGPTVQAAFPRIANPSGIEIYAPELPNSSGRRAALARWLTQPTNGLFLRSTVNRLWQHHFHLPLAESPNDLGTQGDKPSHPELIDWLAAELPRLKWSLKSMHKLVVMSAAYRQSGTILGANGDSSAATATLLELDPAAKLLSRFPSHRMSGEELRDAMLMVSGRLNLAMGGESVRLPLPAEVSETLLDKQKEVTDDKRQHDRRSIYVFARRNLRFPLFDVFDRPDALTSCARRTESVTAPQALTMLNSTFSNSMALSLSEMAMLKGTDSSSIVTEAIWRCYSRPPTEADLKVGQAFLEKQTALTSTLEEAVADYCLALMNASEFCYVD